MTRNRDELFRFLWENRAALGVSDRAYTEVLSIDQAVRVGPDGIPLHETVCQYVQQLDLFGSEFRTQLGADRPEGMKTTDRFEAHGGGVLVLDQYGQVKYHIANPLFDGSRQRARAQYLVDTGQLAGAVGKQRTRFAVSHMQRMGA